jgi:hypothetical protein
MDELRDACARVARRARHVAIDELAIAPYAAGLTLEEPAADDIGAVDANADGEAVAAYWLTLDAINFGSGWFPTLRKRPGLSGYNTIAAAWREHPVLDADALADIGPAAVGRILGQDPDHELMGLYAASLRDLGSQVLSSAGGSFAALATTPASAVELARRLGGWRCFADNLVPHVLRLDGVLHFVPELVARIDRGELIEHGSAEEVEIRACALHAVELIVAARTATAVTSAEVDQHLWQRGQRPVYKAVPRHRSRCTAY